ncbi:hypothetical protein FA09DRAFT_317585 [Tilletiopsis washingtonensis]|uniref:Sorting nexin-4 n=1 Tax=Tilletiopsis washingtonensis TaxID=58919 RepID=A0A316ZCR8_9BASI|nr:hypothetical protein FA09DRAFT_317585 [Tilletiopsis washingtonensis]PWN98814.1 hypothetical protein FA09DRAFT_317585 [Tilletiopsis washingtonensis]
MDADDAFTSVTWDRRDDAALHSGSGNGAGASSSRTLDEGGFTSAPGPATPGIDGLTRHALAPLARGTHEADGEQPAWQGFLRVQVCEPRKEHEGTKEMFCSYGIRAETNLAHFSRTRLTTRRRFQDFVFLRENLKKDFPACLVAPLPDKHRMEYFTGDRFSSEFIERRQADLQLFLERVCRHPILQRAQLLRTFLESTEWHVDMHSHVSASNANASADGHSGPGGSAPGGLLDGLTDTLLNAFSKVRKPDEKFEAMKEKLEKLEEGLGSTERVVMRARARHGDLAGDYEEFASAIEGLGYLESGITEPLNRFAAANLEWARLQRQLASNSTDDMLSHTHALLAYTHSHRSVLRLRDQKQLDFEELTDYLSSVVTERDRLASLSSPHGAGHGHGGVRGAGISGYLRDRVDSLRGVDEERTRVQRMQRLDGRIQELQDAVTTSHDISVAFSQQVARENTVFTMAKEQEVKEMLGTYVDGQIDMWRRGEELWKNVLDAWPEQET